MEDAALTRAGLDVVYLSQENGLEEEARRFLRLRPDFDRLHLFVDQGFDLALPSHRAELLAISERAALVVVDTLTACWSGDEDSNRELAAFDRELLKPLQLVGASTLILDHTGNPQSFVRRKGVSAPRGASAKGQKTDFLLEFAATGESSFKLERGKSRGTHGKRPQAYRVVDVVDGEGDTRLDLVEIEATEDAAALADLLAKAIGDDGGPRATKWVRAIAQEQGYGTAVTSAALELLKAEDPPVSPSSGRRSTPAKAGVSQRTHGVPPTPSTTSSRWSSWGTTSEGRPGCSGVCAGYSRTPLLERAG